MPFKFHASRRHKIPKAHYAVKNWPAYEAALRQRGDIQIWIGDDVEAHWTVPGKRTPKGYPVYTDLAIEINSTRHHRQIDAGNIKNPA